ncbi:MAG: hypothetical protein WD801_13280, partial [Gemmatimonadaceae bacterium]
MKTVALTVGAPHKWIDNLLSHHRIPGVSGGRQGVDRRITQDGLLAVEVTRMLATELGLPVHRAVALAAVAIETRSEHAMRVETVSGVVLELPVQAIEARLRERLIEAAESVARPRRGRPPA